MAELPRNCFRSTFRRAVDTVGRRTNDQGLQGQLRRSGACRVVEDPQSGWSSGAVSVGESVTLSDGVMTISDSTAEYDGGGVELAVLE